MDVIYAITTGIIIGILTAPIIVHLIDRRLSKDVQIKITESAKWNVPSKWHDSQNEVEVTGGGNSGSSHHYGYRDGNTLH